MGGFSMSNQTDRKTDPAKNEGKTLNGDELQNVSGGEGNTSDHVYVVRCKLCKAVYGTYTNYLEAKRTCLYLHSFSCHTCNNAIPRWEMIEE